MLFTVSSLDSKDLEVVQRIEEMRSSLKYMFASPVTRWYGQLRRTAFARAIRGSNSIEGYNVSEEDAIAIVQGGETMEATEEEKIANVCYRTAMTYVMQLANDPYFSYSEGFIRSLHYMMLEYELSKNPGRWRPGPIHVRDDLKNEIVYTAPDAELVPKLMAELIQWLNLEEDVPIIIKAALGHLNLTMIHPFSDGNGRMARCLQTLILSRKQILEPPFCSIEEHLGRYQPEYYNVLAEVGKGSWNPQNNTKPWVRFTLTAHFQQAYRLLKFTRISKRIWDALEIEVQRRSLPERCIGALADAAIGLKVRNSTYRPGAEVTWFVATRDLKQMVNVGLLVAQGEKRGRYYIASEILKNISRQAYEPINNENPYEPTSNVPLSNEPLLPFGK